MKRYISALMCWIGAWAFVASAAVVQLKYENTTNALVEPSAANFASANNLVVVGGAGGTPASLTLTNATGLPIVGGTTGTLTVARGGTNLTAGTSGGILYYSATGTLASSGLLAANALVIGGGAGVTPSTTTTGTGILTALGVNTGSAGAPVLFNGALGTPSSGTLSSATGLPISTGVSGLGTGVATALAVNTGSAGAPVLFNGAGGTPSSINLTNATAIEHPITFSVSGGGGFITTGVQDVIANAGYAGTLTRWSVTTSPADTITIDVLRSADAGAAPSASIVGGSGTKPNVSSGVNNHSTTFTNWTSTAVAQYDNFKIQITAVGGVCTSATITLYYQ